MTPPKPPTVRPGQRVPYFKGTQREIDERRGCVARLLARGVRRMKIHRIIEQKFSRRWRTADRDIAWLIHLKWEPAAHQHSESSQ